MKSPLPSLSLKIQPEGDEISANLFNKTYVIYTTILISYQPKNKKYKKRREVNIAIYDIRY